MTIAYITVDNVDKLQDDYMHFKDKSQKAWNCNKTALFPVLVAGNRVKIDFNETAPSGGRKYGSKYINQARLANADDPGNTWPDKEPYRGGGNNGGGVSKDYDPEVGKRQTAANCAMNWIARNVTDADEVGVLFPAIADVVYKWVSEMPKSGVGEAADEFANDF